MQGLAIFRPPCPAPPTPIDVIGVGTCSLAAVVTLENGKEVSVTKAIKVVGRTSILSIGTPRFSDEGGKRYVTIPWSANNPPSDARFSAKFDSGLYLETVPNPLRAEVASGLHTLWLIMYRENGANTVYNMDSDETLEAPHVQFTIPSGPAPSADFKVNGNLTPEAVVADGLADVTVDVAVANPPPVGISIRWKSTTAGAALPATAPAPGNTLTIPASLLAEDVPRDFPIICEAVDGSGRVVDSKSKAVRVTKNAVPNITGIAFSPSTYTATRGASFNLPPVVVTFNDTTANVSPSIVCMTLSTDDPTDTSFSGDILTVSSTASDNFTITCNVTTTAITVVTAMGESRVLTSLSSFPSPSLAVSVITPATCDNDEIFENAEGECDNGPLAGGGSDGCTDTCAIESGWACSNTIGSPSNCSRLCGNVTLDTGEQCQPVTGVATIYRFPGGTCGDYGLPGTGAPTGCDSATCHVMGCEEVTLIPITQIQATGPEPVYRGSDFTISVGAYVGTTLVPDATVSCEAVSPAPAGLAPTNATGTAFTTTSSTPTGNHNISCTLSATPPGYTGDPPGQVVAINVLGCGDGIVQGADGETCDDGNASNNDGCSATCDAVSPGWKCVEGSCSQAIRATTLQNFYPKATAIPLTYGQGLAVTSFNVSPSANLYPTGLTVTNPGTYTLSLKTTPYGATFEPLVLKFCGYVDTKGDTDPANDECWVLGSAGKNCIEACTVLGSSMACDAPIADLSSWIIDNNICAGLIGAGKTVGSTPWAYDYSPASYKNAGCKNRASSPVPTCDAQPITDYQRICKCKQ